VGDATNGIELRWREDYGAAAILRDGAYLGSLSLQPWWPRPEGEHSTAWVAAGLFHGVQPDDYVRVCVEEPAMAVDASRSAEMLEKTHRAIEYGPRGVPGPEEAPAPMRLSADAVNDQLGRVISAWVDALDDLWQVADKRDPDVSYSMYLRLVHVLNWAYTVVEALQAAWNRVPTALKVPASQQADAKVEAAIAEWKTHRHPPWNPDDDPTFKSYFRRKTKGGRPYKDWASVMVAGAFHEEFFGGVKWVSGKMRHSAAALPVELRQMAPGDEPRWKWKLVDAIAPVDKDQDQRAMYVAYLQERDVLGLFSWLVDVFVNAKHFLVKLLREAEANQ